MGTLNIIYLDEDNMTAHPLWNTTGERGYMWLVGEVDLSELGSGWIIVEGTGHMAVDDFRLTDNCFPRVGT